MALDEPSKQLLLDVRASLHESLSSRRPVLHHLNADSSWLLQIPRPPPVIGRPRLWGRRSTLEQAQLRKIAAGAKQMKRDARNFYNVLIDPWLAGGQSDVASWFSQQFHAEASAVGSIDVLEQLITETEILAGGPRPTGEKLSQKAQQPFDIKLWNGAGKRKAEHGVDDDSLIDIVAISHEFTDHCHKATLLEIPSTVPVIAIKEAATLIRSWGHFENVIEIPAFRAGTDWASTSVDPLPQWLGISRLMQTDDVLNHHSALLFNFSSALSQTSRDSVAETILYTPHGIHSTDLDVITTADPPLKPLALLHGLDNVRVGTVSGRTALQSNLGAHNGLKAQRVLGARYWVGTHDEIKTGKGLVAWFLQRDVISIKDALEKERELQRQEGNDMAKEGESWDSDGILEAYEGVNWLQLKNGESRVLV